MLSLERQWGRPTFQERVRVRGGRVGGLRLMLYFHCHNDSVAIWAVLMFYSLQGVEGKLHNSFNNPQIWKEIWAEMDLTNFRSFEICCRVHCGPQDPVSLSLSPFCPSPFLPPPPPSLSLPATLSLSPPPPPHPPSLIWHHFCLYYRFCLHMPCYFISGILHTHLVVCFFN